MPLQQFRISTPYQRAVIRTRRNSHYRHNADEQGFWAHSIWTQYARVSQRATKPVKDFEHDKPKAKVKGL